MMLRAAVCGCCCSATSERVSCRQMAGTRELVACALGRSPGPDARAAWDRVWGQLLARVLAGEDAVPDGTVQDAIPEVARRLAAAESRRQLLRDRCASFLQTNRGPGPACPELWCEARLQDGSSARLHEGSRGGAPHAELRALRRLAQLRDGGRLLSVEVYLNVSPCSECADAMLGFLRADPGVRLSLHFSSLFAHHGLNHRRGLRALRDAGVRLAVFDDDTWEALASCVQEEEEQQQRMCEAVTANPKARGSKRKLEEDAHEPTPSKRQN
ncbi:uncharacterized protein LOC134539284 isoform X2 [Bacillus rossius redtenbacheri]|uniref:uncharacterized protein LOC134539284 isoform X2 n=1 Tax=Bacillus rossius redtenbacheri TaxID=93214 RepID=UPI002FDF0A6C